jgi:hypothetical protein
MMMASVALHHKIEKPKPCTRRLHVHPTLLLVYPSGVSLLGVSFFFKIWLINRFYTLKHVFPKCFFIKKSGAFCASILGLACRMVTFFKLKES